MAVLPGASGRTRRQSRSGNATVTVVASCAGGAARSLAGGVRPAFLAVLAALGCSLETRGGEEPAPRQLVLLPPRVELAGPGMRQTLVAQWRSGDAFLGQATRGVTWASSDERVVQIVEGQAVPRRNGRATLTARCDGQVATAEVRVQGMDRPASWSFRNHVESVLSKQGCNGGACHGARAGQKGFRLSLFGYDPEADHNYLTRQAVGRRIVPSDPGRSLILTKPTGLLPHKGGVRLEIGSLEYQVLADWIASGAPGPREEDPRIAHLEVWPAQSWQQPGQTQQLVVLAHFSDGHVEDATRWARYTSTNSAAATVDERGKVTLVGPGEAAIVVWYLNQTALARVSVPYRVLAPTPPAGLAAGRESGPSARGEPSDAVPADGPANFIDVLVQDKLAALGLLPSPRCDDATFLRRAMLDTLGTLPTPDEVRAFLASAAPDKRERLIDDLLARPQFVDYWAYRWSDLLLLSGQRLRPQALQAFYQWIRTQVRDNTPWDQMVRQIITAAGSTHEHGAANFYALHQDAEDMAETVAQAFLGLSINCARCHNHPLEKWTNDQYYAFANLFARVRAKGWGGDFRSGDGLRVVYVDPRGDLIQPGRGRPQPPAPLDGPPLPLDSPEDRRLALADWLTAPDNPYFTRAIVNRVWANFLGVGLVEPVDDLRLTNPASHEALLDALGRHLMAHRYDLKALMRSILQSHTYQRSSRPLPENQVDQRYYARFYPRRLKAEVLLDALAQVTGVPTRFKTATPDSRKPGTEIPGVDRALRLADAYVDSYFLEAFGKPERLITCECERSNEPSVGQALHLFHGETLLQKLAFPGGAVERAAAEPDDAQVVQTLFLAALSRPPAPAELETLTAELRAAGPAGRRQAIEDLYWAVLTSREFLFQH